MVNKIERDEALKKRLHEAFAFKIGAKKRTNPITKTLPKDDEISKNN